MLEPGSGVAALVALSSESSREFSGHFHIHPIVLGALTRCFHDERQMLQGRMLQNVGHALSDSALGDMPVLVTMGTTAGPGIVEVDQEQPFQTYDTIEFRNSPVYRIPGPEVITRSKGMGSIQDNADPFTMPYTT